MGCLNLNKEIAFLAAKRFEKSKKSKSKDKTPLSDFFIGAHAECMNIPLVTRNPKDFKYFPAITLINPTDV